MLKKLVKSPDTGAAKRVEKSASSVGNRGVQEQEDAIREEPRYLNKVKGTNNSYLLDHILDLEADSVKKVVWVADAEKWWVTARLVPAGLPLHCIIIVRILWLHHKDEAVTVCLCVVVGKYDFVDLGQRIR